MCSKSLVVVFCLALLRCGAEPVVPTFPERTFLITAYGAKQAAEKCTSAIACAIADCAKAGGGRVVVPAGVWRTGPIHLRSNVNLVLENGAVLSFSDDPADYLPAVQSSWEGLECLNYSPLVYAFGCTNVAVTGSGTLRPRMGFWRQMMSESKTDVQGARAILYKWGSEGYPVSSRDITKVHPAVLRPQCVQFNRSKNVLVEGVRIEDSPFWTLHLFLSEDVTIRRIDVCAHGFNNDGVDIEMSRNVLVEDCSFDQGDDGFVFKAGRNQDGWRLGRPTENVEIRNCRLKKVGSVVGVGSELSGGIANVWVHDCVAEAAARVYYVKTNHRRGGIVRDVTIENVHVGKTLKVAAVETDVLYQWAAFPDYETRVTAISNLTVRNVTCDGAKLGVDLAGDPKNPIRNVCIENVKVGTLEGDLYRARNVRGVVISNLTCVGHGQVVTPWDAEPGIPGIADNPEGSRPAFFLPERLFAAPDTECNIYFKDVFDSCVPQNYAFQALSPVGESQVERWHWTPTPSDAGRSVPVVISAWQEGVDPVAVVTTVVEVARAPFSPDRRMTVSVFADSLANSGFPQRIRDRMLEGGFSNLVSVGSRKGRTPSEAAHDGYGGFTCRAFMTRYAMSNDEFLHIQDEAERQQLVALGIPVREVPERQRVLLKSPFVRLVDGKPTFDIGWWLDCVNGGAAPDVIVVMLGVNDFFSYTGRPNEVRVRMLADVFPSFSEFIGKLRDKMPRTRIAICTIPNGCGQDGFGANYGAGQNEVQHRKNVFVFNRELKRFVEESDDANLELLPVAHAVDPVNAFPHVSVPANACTDEKVKRDGNALHSTAVGGRQIGDSISAWLQCRWDEIVDRYGKPVR